MEEGSAETRIYLLGRFAVEVSGRAIPAAAWRKRRPIELLTAVALAPGRVLHREELIDRLWPDKDLDAGANNLHRAFHDLRRITGTEIATLDRGAARLAEHAWVDVVAFEQAAAGTTRETLVRAIELHAGALLPDDPYSDALVARREGLRQRFVDAGLRLAKLQHEANDPEACVHVLRRVLEQDPAIEPAHQLLMRILAETGRAGDALRQFGECTNALRARLDVAPSRATLDLRAAIERGELKAKAAPPPRIETKNDASLVVRRLLGGDRGREMHGRADAVQTVRTFVGGGRGVLLVVGEAGLGKTRLAGECARIAAQQGATVLVGVGLDHDSGVPYASFADAWGHHRRTTSASEASDPFASFSPSSGSAQEDRLRLFQSVERAVETLSERGGVCVVIEDLHDADPSSLHLFHHLSRATRSLPLLLVGTLREEEVRVGTPLHTLLGSLGRERLASRVTLERLDREATARLVGELVGRSEDEVVDAVYALAEGNPFHTEEVVQAMREEGTTRPTAPADLLETVRLRVRRLGRDAERLFAAAAVVGMRFPFEVARLASNLSPELALEALDLGIEAQIVEEDAGEVRFRHALTRTALLSALTQARRVYLHRAVAEAFEATVVRSDHAEVLALHHEAAGQLDRALPYLVTAGERAQKRLGFSEAIAFFERARGVMDALGMSPNADRYRVLRALGGMRIALSDLDGAVRDLDEAAAVATAPTEIAMVRRIAALALIQGGLLSEAGKRLDGALAAFQDSDAHDPELPAVLYLFAQLRWHEEKYTEARELAERSLAEAEARGDRRAMSKGHEMLALCCHSLGAWQEGQAHEAARQALADGTLDVDQAFDVHLCLWEYHLYAEQGPSTIRTAVDQTLEQAQRMKAPRAVALCESFAGTLDFQTGRWNEAESQLRRAIDRFRQVGSASGEALSLQRLAVLLTARGDLDAGRACIDEGIVVGGRAAMRSHCLTRLHATLARNRLAADDRDGAHVSLREGLAEAARHGHCATCNAHLLPEAVRVELAWGNQREAEVYATKLEDVAERFGTRAWAAIATQARARVLGSRGDKAEAFAAFDRARIAFEELGSPYEAARCLMAQGRVLGGARGRALTKAAGAAFSALGAADLEA